MTLNKKYRKSIEGLVCCPDWNGSKQSVAILVRRHSQQSERDVLQDLEFDKWSNLMLGRPYTIHLLVTLNLQEIVSVDSAILQIRKETAPSQLRQAAQEILLRVKNKANFKLL